jgi:hypothetical protein
MQRSGIHNRDLWPRPEFSFTSSGYKAADSTIWSIGSTIGAKQFRFLFAAAEKIHLNQALLNRRILARRLR